MSSPFSSSSPGRVARVVSWLLRGLVALILLQTLFFKFRGAAESRWIFETLGVEPWGRIGSGVVELLAAILILLPRTVWLGAALALGTIVGAILSHLFILGLEVQGDGGLLFALACVVAVASATVLFLHRDGWLPLLRVARNPD